MATSSDAASRRKMLSSSLPFEEFYPAHPAQQERKTPLTAESYEQLYKESIESPETFWGRVALEQVSWVQPFPRVLSGDLLHGDYTWFAGGRLNVAYNCVERHVDTQGDKTAILWEGDKGESRSISFRELHREVGRLGNALRAQGVRKGDTVAIYMPMVPEAAIAMLACARIGAVHSVIFAGFSAEAIRDRVQDAKSKVIITADEGLRGGRIIPLKRTMDEALLGCPLVQTVVVYKRTSRSIPWHPTRDVWYHEICERERCYCPAEPMDAEDPLFILYTSGSTGKPKGLVHTTGGYLVHASFSHSVIFDARPGDVYACVADVGWITGHSYIVYGPLCNGVSTLLFESLPTFPDASRYWELVEKYRITQFYTSPTALRALMKYGDEPVLKHDRSSLRVLGSVGEPINPEAWRWYYKVVGESRCSIVDTYWQTETGGIIFCSLPGVHNMKPGSCGRPFFGVDYRVLDGSSGEASETGSGVLTLTRPVPGQARTILADHGRFCNTYLNQYPGMYFTGDGCVEDHDGFVWISGRVDDVINKAGHRLGTAEIEGALTQHPACAEAAVIAIPDDVKGQAVLAYCLLRQEKPDATVTDELKLEVRKHIGGIAVPDYIILAQGLPKTRSGKIMRRILRKIGVNELDTIGDISTLAEPDVVEVLIELAKTAGLPAYQ